MRIKIRDTRAEVMRRTAIFFNEYSISDSTIKIYYNRQPIATINLESMILEADLKKINRIGSMSENLKVCKNLDMLACV